MDFRLILMNRRTAFVQGLLPFADFAHHTVFTRDPLLPHHDFRAQKKVVSDIPASLRNGQLRSISAEAFQMLIDP